MKNVQKATVGIVLTSVALIFSIIGLLITNGSLAWFSNNGEVTGDGFSVNAHVSPNLMIGKTVNEVMGDNILFSVDFNGTGRNDMIAVTRDDSIPNVYLKYLTNHYAVDSQTGLTKGDVELEFDPVPSENNERYFTDYTVFIASSRSELSVASLKATIVIPETVDDFPPFFYAASIDFYVEEANVAGYRGTLSVAAAKGGAAIDLFAGEGGTVPLNTESYITVIMRCYFDGALTDNTGKAYINSYTVGTDSIPIGVDFTATDISQ